MKKTDFLNIGIYSNPTTFFAVLTAFLTIAIIVNTGFHLPDYYINSHVLEEIRDYNIAIDSNFIYIEPGYQNPLFVFQNSIFQIFTFSLSFLIFAVIMKIRTWGDFKELKPITNKKFVYIWLNVLAPLILILKAIQISSLCDLQMTPAFDHSAGLCFIFIMALLILYLIFYFPITNTVFFLIYNKNKKNKFLKFMLYCFMAGILIQTIVMNSYNYSPLYLLFNLSDMVWIYLLLSALRICK